MEAKRDSEFEDFPWSATVSSGLSRFRAYRRTRRAVRDGRALHDLSQKQLEGEGLLGPWTFNLTESFLASLPAVLLAFLLDYLFATDLDLSGKYVDDLIFEDTFAQIWNKVLGVIPPLVLGLSAYAAARGSLRREDATQALVRRNARAYLYFDGARGLFPQMILAIAFLIHEKAQGSEAFGLYFPLPNTLGVPFGILLIGASIHQVWFTEFWLPRRLFAIQGYELKRRNFWTKRQPTHSPWSRYQFLTTIALALVGTVLYAALWGGTWTASYVLTLAKIRTGDVERYSMLLRGKEAQREEFREVEKRMEPVWGEGSLQLDE